MKKYLFAVLMLSLAACSDQKTPEQKVQEQINSKLHALTSDERLMAEANAKQFYERQWTNANNQRGMFVNCRPSDSNFNGLVTCFGKVPLPAGGYVDMKMYCGYMPALTGCSDEDTATK